MKFVKYALFAGFLAFAGNAQALTDHQEYVKGIAKEVGQEQCTDEMCFGKTLQAIAWQESSYGLNIIGDDKGTVYYYMHNDAKVSVKKSETFLRDGLRYYWYQPVRNRYLKRVYSETAWKPLHDSSLGTFQIKVDTAKRVIRKRKLTEHYDMLDNEKVLVARLLNDIEFGAEIAANYLIMNYEIGKRRGYKSPWRFAVSRYNGGNNNIGYIKHISDKLKRLP